MAQKERYVCKKISKDCLFPETLCELKDTESKFFVILESKDDAVKIVDLLNQQDKEIKQLKEQIEQMAQDYASEIAFCTGASNKQIAIRELEDLKSKIEKFAYNENRCLNKEDAVNDFIELVDEQIKNLKGE